MSALATSLNSSIGLAVCRVCLCGESSIPYLGNAPGEPLISPCLCKGSMGLYHRSCLEHWLSVSRTYCCEICKFKYQIGRRKQSFWTYLRTHWIGADLPRSLSSECVCLLLLFPSTVGGAVLCIETVAEMIRDASEYEDYGKILDILAIGIMGFIFIFTFGALVICTIVSCFNDFRKWQKKNVVLYVIDQLDREEECSQSHNLPDRKSVV